jgi:hypothetical protein
MKTVWMFVITVCFLLFFQHNSSAQHLGIYAHALYAAPIDKSSNALYTGGAGGEAGLLVGRKSTRFGASIGYSRFFADDNNVRGAKTYVPVKAGVRQYLPLTLNFLFLQADAGLGFVSNANTDTKNSPFAFDFGAGVKFTAFEAMIAWDNFHETDPSGLSSWFTVKAGINLGF